MSRLDYSLKNLYCSLSRSYLVGLSQPR